MDYRELKDRIRGKVDLGAPVAPWTSYRLGGRAGALVEPQDTEDLAELLKFIRERKSKYVVLGGGSNALFADEGLEGVVIRLGRGFQSIKIEGDLIRAKAATKLVSVMNRAREEGLGGLEFCAGVPGNIGGAVVGNAGAKKDWVGPRVVELTVVTPEGKVRKLGRKDYQYSYRHSSLKGEGSVLAEVVLKADREPKAVIEGKIREYYGNRRGKQPRLERNAGSVFKNPPGDFAGRMTESLGMKGFRVGGASVSQVHANFIINDEGGTAHDVAAVMREVQKRVEGKYGVRLEPEIIPMGDWNWAEVKDIWWNLTGPYYFQGGAL